MTSRDELFEPLEPPPGGLQRLRARLDAPRTRSAPIWIFAVATCALALGAVALQAPPREPVTVPPSGRAEVAVVRVPLRDERVVFYWVASATDPHWNGSDAQP
jgi:hypothetical protein